MWLAWGADSLLPLVLVTMVHPFDPLLYGQSIQHGTYDGGPHLMHAYHHDHQHLWLWIMNFSRYVSGLG